MAGNILSRMFISDIKGSDHISMHMYIDYMY